MVRGLDGFFDSLVALCGFEGHREGDLSPVSGGFGEGETPLPIPNREVKPLSADGTWLERARESRSPPVCLIPRAAPPGRLVVVEAEATLATQARRRWRKPAGSGAWRRGTESPTATAVARRDTTRGRERRHDAGCAAHAALAVADVAGGDGGGRRARPAPTGSKEAIHRRPHTIDDGCGPPASAGAGPAGRAGSCRTGRGWRDPGGGYAELRSAVRRAG